MGPQDQAEREEELLHEMRDRGELTEEELRAELRDLRHSYQAAAEEAAQDAYDDVMRGWF